ncbi:MAG: 16S rRNA (cytidine(1402)-2'-O)-methyltransferase [Coxiella sp. RIFCSPHIGHO2_12_FULL_44_14]|nr:MAG: 16S rRNA (cytidine(1402)-2'-O)-methyltransferase [Coxiella sp. RIFCSPHIGHO2_12_FULL_44_14]
MTFRAVRILQEVSMVAAEDTRHSRRLMQHYGIHTPMVSLHEHNEVARTRQLIQYLQKGTDVALIADAGMPLISDPGYHLVKTAHAMEMRVVPIPGASAVIAALAVSGLPTDRFVFEGFLPARDTARMKRLQALTQETRTMVFYESVHRIMDLIVAMTRVFEGERPVTLARELTKTFETVYHTHLSHLKMWLEQHPQQRRGEFVIVLAGAPFQDVTLTVEHQRVLEILLKELSLKQAVALSARLTGVSRKVLYTAALKFSPR